LRYPSRLCQGEVFLPIQPPDFRFALHQQFECHLLIRASCENLHAQSYGHPPILQRFVSFTFKFGFSDLTSQRNHPEFSTICIWGEHPTCCFSTGIRCPAIPQPLAACPSDAAFGLRRAACGIDWGSAPAPGAVGDAPVADHAWQRNQTGSVLCARPKFAARARPTTAEAAALPSCSVSVSR